MQLGLYLGGGSPSSTSIFDRLFCLIRDHPNVQEMWGKGDYIRDSGCLSVFRTRLIQFLNISSGLFYISDGLRLKIYLCDVQHIHNESNLWVKHQKKNI